LEENKNYSFFILIGFCVLFFSIGLFRFGLAEKNIEESVLVELNDSKEDFIVEGIVIKETDIEEESIKITLKPLKVGSFKEPKGRILVTLNRFPEYNYGDKLRLVGKIKSVPIFEGFNYKDYLRKEGVCSLMYFPEVKLLKEDYLKNGYSFVLSFKNKMREKLNSLFSPPSSLLLNSILLGDKGKIPDDWKEKLNVVGLRHITAVSGMHVAIILGIVIFILKSFKLSRVFVFFFSSLFVFLFIALTGFQVSALRAGVMAFLFLSAEFFYRRADPLKVLSLTAFLFLLLNPFLLRSDAGFQLSFSAMLGIFCFLPFLRVEIGKIFLKIPNFLGFKDILALSLSAQIFTLPILIYNFSYFSLVSLLSNILIIPFLPFLMIFGFLSGIFFTFLGKLFSFPAFFLLEYIKIVVNFLSSFSFSSVEIKMPFVFLLVIFSFFLYLGIKIKKESSEWFLNF
jgi:competence protein ComEC